MGDELRQSYDGTLEALVNALDARDQETKGHSLRVSKYMMDIARELGVVEDSREWLDMQRGSLLHDVGKIGVSDSILLKPGKLTDDEWKLMRLHPEIGYKMLRQVKFLEGPAEIILAHHERWDGKGYPRGLAEDEIPLGARIFPVVDTFDAMTSDRPYRKALSTQDALNEILKYGGSQFDPQGGRGVPGHLPKVGADVGRTTRGRRGSFAGCSRLPNTTEIERPLSREVPRELFGLPAPVVCGHGAPP